MNQKGYAIIIGVIIMTSAFMLIVVLGAKSIQYNIAIIQEQVDQSASDLLAESCAQTVLRAIVDDPDYTGDEVVNTPEGDCNVGAISLSLPTDIQIETIVEDHVTRLVVTIDDRTPPNVTNWVRVDDF